MTKDELREALENGTCVGTLFDLSDGQECLIFKEKLFEVGDDILYIPDVYLNEIPLWRSLKNEEIEEVIDKCYTGNDFLKECTGDANLAKALFCYCDWQHPSSALSEVIDYVEEE